MEEQPSLLTILPSSHVSDPSLTESPQIGLQDPTPYPEHVQPVSTVQVEEHPSPETVLPSSQVSGEIFKLSPHIGVQDPAPVPTQEYPVSF